MIDDDIKKIMLKIGKDFISNLEDEEEYDYEECGLCDCEDDSVCYIRPGYCDCNIPNEYDKIDFINFVMDYGGLKYKNGFVSYNIDNDILRETASFLEEKISAPYFSVKIEDGCMVIATPTYIRNAPIVVAKTLGIIPEVFTEVSGPSSTVLILDCEKQWLRMRYLGLGVNEWLL